MEQNYWIGRQHAAVAMASRATCAHARLIHYDLAGRYSIKAAQCLPFMVPATAPATESKRLILRLPTLSPATGERLDPLRQRKPGSRG